MKHRNIVKELKREQTIKDTRAVLEALRVVALLVVGVVAMNYFIKLVAVAMIVLQSVAGTYQI